MMKTTITTTETLSFSATGEGPLGRMIGQLRAMALAF